MSNPGEAPVKSNPATSRGDHPCHQLPALAEPLAQLVLQAPADDQPAEDDVLGRPAGSSIGPELDLTTEGLPEPARYHPIQETGPIPTMRLAEMALPGRPW